MKDHNCYKCVHRRDAPGSAHSSCAGASGNGFLASLVPHKHGVILNPHGVKMGWALWPLNFDPCWVNECELFKPKIVVGMRFVNQRPETDTDENGEERTTPPGNVWRVTSSPAPNTWSIVCDETGGWINPTEEELRDLKEFAPAD